MPIFLRKIRSSADHCTTRPPGGGDHAARGPRRDSKALYAGAVAISLGGALRRAWSMASVIWQNLCHFCVPGQPCTPSRHNHRHNRYPPENIDSRIGPTGKEKQNERNQTTTTVV